MWGPQLWGSPQRKTFIITDQLQMQGAVTEPALISWGSHPLRRGERPACDATPTISGLQQQKPLQRAWWPGTFLHPTDSCDLSQVGGSKHSGKI